MGSIGSPRSAGRALDDEDDDLPPVAPRRAASAGSTARSQPGASAALRVELLLVTVSTLILEMHQLLSLVVPLV
jgi:hypothetical protein